MQLSSFDRYLPCNSHHIHETVNQPTQQQQQRQQRQTAQQPQQQQTPQQQRQSIPLPRTNRISFQRTPQVHIQRSVPNSVRFANFLSNHLQGQISRASARSHTQSLPASRQSSSDSDSSTSASGNLNDAQLNTLIPIFGPVQLQIRDFVNVSPTPSTLNRIRSELRDYMMLKLSLTSNPSSDSADVDLVIFF